MLGLMDQLNQANKDLTKRREQSAERQIAWQRVTEKARLEHTANAIERYRLVMTAKSWLTQSQIEQSLGYASTVSTGFLKKLVEDLKLVERRNRDGAVKYNRMRGFEYRWITGEQNGTELPSDS